MGDGLIGGLSNFLGLDAILDPGAEDRRRGLDAQDRATQLWMDQMGTLPGAEYYNAQEGYIGGPGSMLTDSALSGNRAYQESTEAQLRALRSMQGIAEAGGYTAADREQIGQAQRQAAMAERSQREAQLQQMAMRGMQGGGAEMAARMQAQQSGANQGRADAATIATQAQMRALQAMQAAASAGAQSQSSAMNRASALDAFNQANTNRQQGVNQRNAASQTASRIQATQDRFGVLAGATGQFNMNASNAAQDARDRAAQTSGLINTAIQVAS